MKTVFDSIKYVFLASRLAALLLSVWFAGPAAFAQALNSSTNVYGSGKQYKTTIQRHCQGSLSAEDLHQASILTSQILTHVHNAAQELSDSDVDRARPEIDRAQSLLKVVRNILPTTEVTTIVTDAEGKEVYRDNQQVQDDQIPIYAGDVAVEVAQPIVDAKRDEAALKGVKLADAALIHTAVLVDLSLVEQKLRRAAEILNNPARSAAELTQLEIDGVHFYANKEDSPLVQVQIALRLAERLVREHQYEGAKANLQSAKIQLDAYRTLVGDAAGHLPSELEKEIQRLSEELQKPEAVEEIRGMWDRVASWFKTEPGQAHQVTNEIQGTTAAK
jgi:hypothetical protein